MNRIIDYHFLISFSVISINFILFNFNEGNIVIKISLKT